MKIRSELKITDNINKFETISMLADSLIDMLYNKKHLNKKDRELLIDAVNIIYELRVNKE